MRILRLPLEMGFAVDRCARAASSLVSSAAGYPGRR